MKNMKIQPHGGNIYEASRVYGINEDDFLDYSANINPLGIPKQLKELLISSIENVINYPDPGCTGLKNNISKYLNIEEDNIVIGNGASEIIFLLFDVLKLQKVLIPAPTFSEYGNAASHFGADTEYFELKEEDDFKLDIDKLISRLADRYDSVFICNPNNPTSTLVSKEDLLKLLDFTSRHGIYTILDEAFIELTVDSDKNSMSGYLSRFNNLFIIRAFTKVFAIPGLRLGYGLGNSELISKMWDRKLPWSVNSLAISAGEFLPLCNDYLAETCKWLAEEKEWLFNELKNIGKLKAFKPQTNFILLEIKDESLNVGILKDNLASRGILIRDASNFRFLDNRFFRIAVKDRESNSQFLKILKNIL